MSSSTAEANRVDTLLAQTDEAIEADRLLKAAELLREASKVNSKDARIEERWLALQRHETGANVVGLLRDHLSNPSDESGSKALQTLKSKQLAPNDAVEALDMLLQSRENDTATQSDALTGSLITRNLPARKSLAVRISSDATETFELLFHRGPESFNALAALPVEDAAWGSKDAQITAQKDVFRLGVATLIEAGADRLETAMKCVARLLAVVPDTVAPIVDADVFGAILSCLDIRTPTSLRSQTMLATSKFLEATKERGEGLFSDFITEKATRQTNDDLIDAFSAAAAVFPVIPAVTARLFLVDGFVQQLVPNLEKNWDEGEKGKRKSLTLETAALELLSAACVDKNCREAIKRYCSHWLENLTEEREGTHKALAALVLAKISEEAADDVTSKLEQLVLTGDAEKDQAIEGLAYTSLQPRVREDIIGNTQLLERLVAALKDRPAVSFGCLTVFSNLTGYRPALTEEQKKMSQLKAYANSSKPGPDDPLENDAHVTARCRKVLDADIVAGLLACCRQTTSPTNVALVVRILLSLAQEQRHRPRMAQQGAPKLLLQIRDRIAKTDKSSPEASAIERDTSHALARLLISVNPSHIFSSALPATSAVSALVPLLSHDQEASPTRNLLPTFEALLALTNLASMDDASVRDFQLRTLWSQLEDHLLLSSTPLVQRASVELLCNLMASPHCVAKFVSPNDRGSARGATRLRILLALADVEDAASRRAAGGAIAMLTEWDAAVSLLLDLEPEKGVGRLLGMCSDDDLAVQHRGLVCVGNVVGAPGPVGVKGKEVVKRAGGVDIMGRALVGIKDRDVMAVGVEVLQLLQS